MIEINKELSGIKVYDVLGTKCWSTSGVAKAIGMHRNTVANWVSMTLEGKLDLPIATKNSGKRGKKKNNARIPIDEFIRWYSYIQN